MPTDIIRFSENLYSFNRVREVIAAQTAGGQQLSDISEHLANAAAYYSKGYYGEAINEYRQAESLIYLQIDPGYTPNPIGDSHLLFPRDPGLFKSLLSASLEWANLIPVKQPSSSVVGRIAPDESLLASMKPVNEIGITSAHLAGTNAKSAVADFHLAQALETTGNSQAASFFLNRAKTSDSKTVHHLTTGNGEMTHPSTTFKAEAVALAKTTAPATTTLPPSLTSGTRTLGMMVGDQINTVNWSAGGAPPVDDVTLISYTSRINSQDLASLIQWVNQPSQLSVDLPHQYYYVIPLGLALCYQGLGDYATAETYFLTAASYQYLNTSIEAPYLWLCLANLYLAWGDSLFSNDDPASALPIYIKVIAVDKTVPPASSPLYGTASLKPGADPARTVITSLDALISGSTTVDSLNVNPAIATVIIDVWQQIRKINAGLDFFGIWAPSVPIWTFDYLQSVAINFTQLAMSAEKDMINYWDRADQGKLTRDQLNQNVAQAKADQYTAKMEQNAALAELSAYGVGVNLAVQRANDATTNATEYASSSELANEYQALSTQMQGGDDPDAGAIAGPTLFIGSPNDVQNVDGVGSGGTGAAIAGYMAASVTSAYETGALNRTAQEMQIAAQQAQKEMEAASARNDVANAAAAAAQLRTKNAQSMVAAFNSQYFTPDVWKAMGDAMEKIYRRYLQMALYAARRMQQAYNFETDQSLAIIKSNYSSNEIKGTLAAESLMADIQTFTYELISTITSKPQPIKQTISLADRYGYLFETQFRKTGTMDFDTRIDDFDLAYPGTYAGRIENLEVEIVGLIPMIGVSGTLTNAGISFYRVPSAAWTDGSSGLKPRVQSAETMVLSDYRIRNDALVLSPDDRMMKIFQGAGVVSTWHLEIPPSINDIDYGAITDIRLTFDYKARFDPSLKTKVLTQIATIPGINTAQRSLPLRWVYPDAYFHFQDTGTLSLSLGPTDFPRYQTQPQITDLGILVATDGTIPASGLKIALSTPTQAAITATTDATGAIQANLPTSPWKPLASGNALGQYKLAMTAADNPSLVKNGTLVLTPLINIALIMKYSFTRRT